ncbi:MAG: hypothetical protein CBD51_002110 [Flavobacteriales bacterium TMED191]|nr:MAG: hypothetical protein CBD51_002110 [Flavobacteriales bacterium TMED191]|tara:strand:+ start:2395 stop:2610 length:216 start_codon:yes stop_codon:yes gene_type:complete
MDKILNDLLVSKEKDTLVEYEKILNKSLDYMSSIENIDESKLDKIRQFVSRVIDEEIDYLVRNPEDYFELF